MTQYGWQLCLAAQSGLRIRPTSLKLRQREGTSRSRHGEALLRQSVPSRADVELQASNQCFQEVLRSDFETDPESLRVRSMSYRGLIYNLELLGRLDEATQSLGRWLAEPHDGQAAMIAAG